MNYQTIQAPPPPHQQQDSYSSRNNNRTTTTGMSPSTAHHHKQQQQSKIYTEGDAQRNVSIIIVLGILVINKCMDSHQ
jgi:hypothetical protein